jgi:hypothetical protein
VLVRHCSNVSYVQCVATYLLDVPRIRSSFSAVIGDGPGCVAQSDTMVVAVFRARLGEVGN